MPAISSAIPDLDVIAVYAVACAVLCITPGPDMSLFLARTMSDGRRAGLAAMMGATAGSFVHTLLAALGLSALIAASATAFSVLKIVGALYLLWLAVDAVRNGSALRLRETTPARRSPWGTFILGMGINLTNPKVVLFFVTFLPQFVQTGDLHASAKLMFLGLFFVVFAIPFNALMVFGAHLIVRLLADRPRLMRGIDYLFAGVFGAFALKIIASERP